MTTELLTRDQILRDISSYPVAAKVTHLSENGTTTFIDISLGLPYHSYLEAKIEIKDGYKILFGEGLWVPEIARAAGVASRLIKGLAYLAKEEEVDELTFHADSPYTIMAMCSLLGTKDIYCVEYIGSRDTIECSTVDAIIDLGIGKTMGVDLTYNGSAKHIETEEPLVFISYDTMDL